MPRRAWAEGAVTTALPPTWARHAAQKAEHATALAWANTVRRRTRCGQRAASIVGWLALPWEGLCVPLPGDPGWDVAMCERLETGAVSLGEAIPHLWRMEQV
jgi:hypothetical protein